MLYVYVYVYIYICMDHDLRLNGRLGAEMQFLLQDLLGEVYAEH